EGSRGGGGVGAEWVVCRLGRWTAVRESVARKGAAVISCGAQLSLRSETVIACGIEGFWNFRSRISTCPLSAMDRASPLARKLAVAGPLAFVPGGGPEPKACPHSGMLA